MSDIIHLIMIGAWYDLVNAGKKTIEYRNATDYYRTRLKNKTKVCFHRGYTSQTMMFKIASVEETSSQFMIHLGERLE